MTEPEWTRFELEWVNPDGRTERHHGWCQSVEVVNGRLNIASITLRHLHIGSLWSHSRTDPPGRPSNGPFA